MNSELTTAIATILAVAASRYLSHREHRKTERKVSIMMNGELKKLIREAVKEAMKK